MASMAKPFVVAVAGGSGSGKTTLVRTILSKLPSEACLVLGQDNYYRDLSHLSPADRDARNFDHPDALDHQLFWEHLEALCANNYIDRPTYEFATHTRSKVTTKCDPHAVIIIDGILALYDERVRRLCSLRVFVDVPDDIRFIRRLQRDVAERGRTPESVVKQYLRTVRPMHEQYVAPTKAHADLLLPWIDRCDEVAGALVSVLQARLG